MTKGHIDGGRIARRWLLVRAVWVAVSLGCAVIGGFGYGPAEFAWHCSAGFAIGLMMSSGINRQRAYLNGWLTGRNNLVESMRTAPTVGTGINYALTYDMVHVLGYEVAMPDDASEI